MLMHAFKNNILILYIPQYLYIYIYIYIIEICGSLDKSNTEDRFRRHAIFSFIPGTFLLWEPGAGT